ncbi:hypothetical protein D3C85_1672010 [compost metagenome]
MRINAANRHLSRGRVQYAGEHFDRRRFTCPIRPDVSDEFPALDLEADAPHRLLQSVFPRKQRAEPGKFPFAYNGGFEILR